MDRSASFLDICNRLVKEVSEYRSGSGYVLVSPVGRGKGEILAYLQEKLVPEGVKFFTGSSHLKTELARYHLYNEILNDALNEISTRDVNGLMNGFVILMEENGGGRNVIVVEGLESVSDESRDFFLYLSRLCKQYNCILIGTYSTNFEKEDEGRGPFLDLIESEPLVEPIFIDRLNKNDFSFLLKNKGYNLPERFVDDLFMLVGSNIEMLRYTLKYYENHGIIDENKEVDDVLYRFFPIPQALEIYYEKILSDLEESQAFLVDMIALIQEETTAAKISRLAGIQEHDGNITLGELEKAGVVVEKNGRYDISNYRLRDIIQNRMTHARKLEIFSVLSESDSFAELPIQMQLNILLQGGKLDLVENILHEQGSSVTYGFGSLKALVSFLTEFIEKRPHSVDAHLARCEALELMGESDSAISCYEDAILEFPDNLMPKMKLSHLTSNSGKYNASLKLLDQIASSVILDDLGRGLLGLEKSYALFKKRDYEQAHKTALEAKNYLKSAGDREKEAEALNILGNICLETFKHDEARKYYEESLNINRSLGRLMQASRNLNNLAILDSYQGNYENTVKIFKELIEKSYLTGDLLTRAYSTYNIAESYYLQGKMEEAKSYIPSAVRLAKLSNRNDLQYRFFRFLSVLNMNELDVNASIEASDKALEAVSDDKEGEFYKVAYAMKEFYTVLKTNVDSDILPSMFLEEFPVDEEYLPIFYSMGAIYFILKGDFKNASKASEICIRRADQMGERFGVLMSRLYGGLVLFFQNEQEKLAELLSSSPEPKTGVGKYDLLINTLKVSTMAEKMSKEDYIRRINNGHDGWRKGEDLVSLYRDTIAMFTLNRVYGVTPDTKSIQRNIPNGFKHAFNTFLENNLVS